MFLEAKPLYFTSVDGGAHQGTDGAVPVADKAGYLGSSAIPLAGIGELFLLLF
jgi:hypothetical protein